MTQRMPCPYNNHILAHYHSFMPPEEENLRAVSAAGSPPMPPTTPHLFVPQYPDNHHHLSDLLSTPRQVGSNPLPSVMHSPYIYAPASGEHLNVISIDRGDLDFPQPSDTYDLWGLRQPPHSFHPDTTYNVSTIGRSTSNSTPYSNFPCQQLSCSPVNNEINPVNEHLPVPGYYHSPIPTSHDSGTLLDEEYPPASYSGTSNASYPCLWTESNVTCNVLVLATRSHMNRHLHAYHGFSGSDTRQTRCHWAGCGESMQQGSIARHMVTCHLQAKVTCPMCSKKLSRQDVISKHRRVCPAAGARR